MDAEIAGGVGRLEWEGDFAVGFGEERRVVGMLEGDPGGGTEVSRGLDEEGDVGGLGELERGLVPDEADRGFPDG